MSEQQGKKQTQTLQERIDALELELSEAQTQNQLLRGAEQTLAQHASNDLWLASAMKLLFNNADPASLNNVLQSLCEQFQLDGCQLCRLNNTQLDIAASATDTTIGDEPVQFSFKHEPRLKQKLLSGDHLIINDLRKSSTLSSQLRDQLLKQGMGALVIISARHHNQLDYFLILQCRKATSNWPDHVLHSSTAIAEAVAMLDSRLRIDRQLSRSEAQAKLALQASGSGLWDWELSSGNFYYSDGIFEMLGYERDRVARNIKHANFRDALNRLAHPDDRQPVINALIQFSQSDKGLFEAEVRLLHRQGHYIWIMARARNIEFDDRGQTTRCIGICTDISHLKQQQFELEHAKTQAEMANKTKSDFLSRMSHEIRTPMNAMVGMSHLLQDTKLTRQQLDYLETIESSSQALLSTINDILDFAKIEAGKIVLNNSHFDLDSIFSNLAKDTRDNAERQALEIAYDIAPDCPTFLRGDALRLEQVLLNLIDNAIKFSKQGNILVKVRVEEPLPNAICLRFSVSDQGIGISKAQQQHLFNAFTQADESSSRQYGGLGLGLSTCQELVNLMGGKIYLKSIPGRGSCFSFTAQFQRSHIGQQPLRTQSHSYHGLRTLIVDDNCATLTLTERIAAQIQLTTTTATSATEAVELLQSGEQFDLILMDYKMSDLDGLTASHQIKNRYPAGNGPKIIIGSAYDQEFLDQQPFHNDCDGFLAKPINASQLFDKIALLFGDSIFDQSPQCSSATEERLKQAHVLLVEDNAVNQKVAVGILSQKKVRVDIANNGQEALDRLHKQGSDHYDLVLMDIEMPIMDGYEATRRIRNDADPELRDTPIVAMTAQAMIDDRDKCLQLGMNGYIAKPVKPKLLYSTIAQFVGQHREQS